MKSKKCNHRFHIGSRDVLLEGFSYHPLTKDKLQSTCKDCNKKMVYARAKRMIKDRERQKKILDYVEGKRTVDYIENKSRLPSYDIPIDIPIGDL